MQLSPICLVLGRGEPVDTGCPGGFSQARALQTLSVVQPAGFSHCTEEDGRTTLFHFVSFPSLEVASDTAYKIGWWCVLRLLWQTAMQAHYFPSPKTIYAKAIHVSCLPHFQSHWE